MHFSKLSRAELLGLVGAALLVVALLFLDWYDVSQTDGRSAGNPDEFICGVNQYSCTGWDAFPIMRWLLLAAAIAPPILSYIVIRGHKLSWAPGEMTMVVGFTAFVLIAYNGIIDPPGAGAAEIGISKDLGYWLALLAAAMISAAGVGRAMETGKGPRKAPGTV